MSIVKFPNVAGGLNTDLSPEELGPGFWSSSQNMRFGDGYASRMRGMTAAFTTPAITPYYLISYATPSAKFIVYAGLITIYCDDGTTRTAITGTAPTGAIDDRWTGGAVNGVLVLNNYIDVPRYWAGVPATPFAALPGWNSAWRCKVMRPFKNYLIALDITKSGTRTPHTVKWSNTLAPGAITASGDWDETNPAIDAGEQDIAGEDLLVDCLPLGDVNIIYKERSMWAMSLCGAPYIFRFQKLPGEYGMLARGCAENTPLGHVVMTSGDIIIHSGQGCTSIANAVIRNYIFSNISQTYYQRSFVTSNPGKNEVWVCFPFGSEASTCNRAAVWNWVDKTWAIRTLTNVTYGTTGKVNYSASGIAWSDASTTWETQPGNWNDYDYSPAESRLMLCHTNPYISLADVGPTDFGSVITSTLERTGMHIDNPQNVKVCKAVYPRIDGTTGQTVQIEIGGSMTANVAPTWSAPVTFTIGTDQKIDAFAAGRYLSVRFTHTGYSPWRIRSFDMDVQEQGKF